MLLFQISENKQINRLKYRNPPWPIAENLMQFYGRKLWNEEQAKKHVTNKDLIIKLRQNMEGILSVRKK